MRRQPPKVPRPTPVPRTDGPLDLTTLSSAEVAAFWAGPGAVQPLVTPQGDGTSLVTFCCRDQDAQAVLLFANRLTDETDLRATLLTRMPGTDLFHATYRMDDDWRASYSFLVHRTGEQAPWQVGDQVQVRQVLDRGRPDPRNPVGCHNRAGVRQSVVQLPDAPPQPWLRPHVPLSGFLSAMHTPEGRRVWFHDPAGPGLDQPLPLLVLLDGEVWVRPEQGLLAGIEAMVASALIPPLRVLLVSSGGRDTRWQHWAADGSGVEEVADDLLPWARARRGVGTGPAQVAVAGQSLGGLTALRLGLLRPDAVGAVISHSASLWQDDLSALACRSERARIFLSHGRQEWVLAPPHERLTHQVRSQHPDLTPRQFTTSVHNGGHDYAWWRGGITEGLQWWLAGEEPAGAR